MKVRKMRCRKCKTLGAVKNGKRKILNFSLDRKSSREIQRYKCNECGRTFSQREQTKGRYTLAFKIELTRMHIEERMSYRVISKRIREEHGIRISKNTICRMVNEVAGYSKGDIKIKEEYKPKWQGYLTVDDKYFSIDGEKKLILTATDSTGDLVHIEVFATKEQQGIDGFMKFIKERLEYPFKGITTDLDEMLEKSIKKELGREIPHQKCLKHALDIVDKIIQLKQKRKGFVRNQNTYSREKEESERIIQEYEEAETIFKIVKEMLFSSDKNRSSKMFEKLKYYIIKYPKLGEFIIRHKNNLFVHQKYPDIKKTNNIAENINRQLMRRLKTIESFQKLRYANNYLNLYKNYLRFKPYTDCRGNNRFKNGKSPLEVCGVVIKNKDWLKNSIAFY